MVEARATSLAERLTNEVKALAKAALFFALCIGMLVTIKTLVLAEYSVEFRGFSMAVFGVLVLSKVVLVLEHVPLGAWVSRQPALVDVTLRTVLYGVGVFAVLLLENAFEGRHEAGGFGPALTSAFEHADVDHVIVNVICLSGALLAYNLLAVVRQRLGPGGLTRLFLSPIPEAAANGHR